MGYQDKSARLCRDNSVTLCQDNNVVRCPSRSVRQLNLHMEESKQKKQIKPRLTICKTKPPNERFKFLSRTPDSSTILFIFTKVYLRLFVTMKALLSKYIFEQEKK